ncbi:MAG TPA: hypothetical protein ENI41_03510, partial [Deltaproteobacteria bacterium]|nr:hypothetical protein [Deltaproteobacteria bacterium]
MKRFKPEKGILFQLIITIAIVSIVASFVVSQGVSIYIKDRFQEHFLERTRDVLELCFVACDDAFQFILSERQEDQQQVVDAVKKGVLLRIKNLG